MRSSKWLTQYFISHACSRSGVTEYLRSRLKAALKNQSFEEAVVNQLTSVMMGVFRDNPWMIDMVKTQLEDSEDAD